MYAVYSLSQVSVYSHDSGCHDNKFNLTFYQSLNQIQCSCIFANQHDDKTMTCKCMPELTDTCKIKCNCFFAHFPHLFTLSIIVFRNIIRCYGNQNSCYAAYPEGLYIVSPIHTYIFTRSTSGTLVPVFFTKNY